MVGMMRALRGRRGLEADDTSQDEEIFAMKPAQIVLELCAWELGDETWARRIAGWMKLTGATIDEVIA
jgi:hypothetical protein